LPKCIAWPKATARGEGAGVRVEDKLQYCYCGKLTRVGRSPMHIAQAWPLWAPLFLRHWTIFNRLLSVRISGV
jgi:hypothetical protein